MRDIEQARGAARVLMLAENAQGVLDRHVIAGERHHLGAELHMEIVEWGAFEGIRL
jgi:hypothetical protein